MLGLAATNDADDLQPDPALPPLMPTSADTPDRFPPSAAGIVFQRLLACPECTFRIHEVLSCVRISEGQLTIPWLHVPTVVRPNIAWLWLQQLGLAQHAGSDLILNPILLPYVADSLPTLRSLSQAELEERLAAQKARAAIAEEHIMELEQQRLIMAGCPHYAVGVRRVSLERVDAGYDIRSFETTGAPRFIEVKSSAGPRAFFFLSRNEYRSARRYALSYWIAWVGWAVRLPEGPCDVAWFPNPAESMKKDPSIWRVTSAQLCVERMGDDTLFQRAP
jgi:hypothetical protein